MEDGRAPWSVLDAAQLSEGAHSDQSAAPGPTADGRHLVVHRSGAEKAIYFVEDKS
ncbi:hypothetical protein [Brevibacterium sp.]|uniref:hypothetical protein n=1 Tax=Brevibacterium sp. TaxID=1701 RepID=UPI002811F005|nr:hypothetical protein [Brevibacterium sp.]